MAKCNCYILNILAFILILKIRISTQIQRQCHQGLKTPGYTEPHGDILIEYGNPLDIICTLYDDYVEMHGPNSSSNLYFDRDDKEVPSEMIKILNSSSIRLHIEKPPKSVSMYTCKLKGDDNAVCLNNVVVGTKPLPVEDFECIGYNYENLTCAWTAPENYVKTYYNLTYYFPGRAARYLRNTCPKFDQKANRMSCLWTITSLPQYRQAQRTFYFELNITNGLGSRVINRTFSHFQHVLSGPPENLTLVNTTSGSVFLRWSVPFAMHPFPPGLEHRILYQSEYGNKNWQFGGIIKTIHSEEMKHVYFNLTNLKYAHALYDIRVSMRSCAAEPSDESMWSKNSSITVRTQSKVPGVPPKTNIGSFEIVTSGESLSYREIFVYWQQIPDYIKNGPEFSYEILIKNGESAIKPVEVTQAYAKFTNLSVSENYTFHIWSKNNAGKSEDKSTVFVPKQSQRIGEPIIFTKIAYGNGRYELSWEPPKSRPFYQAEVQNYTIFWCAHDRDRPYQCSGYLDWIEIPSDRRVHNITFKDDFIIRQFAISANTNESSSGMVWAACTVIHNQAVGKLKSVRVSRVGSDYIELSWKLDCADRVGSIEGFVIYYCNIVSPADASCEEKEQNKTITSLHGGSSVEVANITGLKPYETYILAIAVLTKQKSLSQKSDYQYQTTLEAAPSPPLNLSIINVTNCTILISWKKPKNTNGKLKYYVIEWESVYNRSSIKIDCDHEMYNITNLISYVEYKISVTACTVSCSDPSSATVIKTKGGFPDRVRDVEVVFHNTSRLTVKWDPPLIPRGRNDIYQIRFKEKLHNENKSNAIVDVNETRYLITDCGENGKYNTFYVSVRAINIFDGNRYEGPWSDELESYCLSSTNLWIWALIPICIILLAALFYMFKKMYIRCQKMRDVEVKLPPGLAPVITPEISLAHWGAPKIPDEQNRIPSADEELLLKMPDTRIHSGDSSGCSSGHESVTSSIESGSHLSNSSDSGTEQPHPSSSTEDVRKNSLRLRNVAARPSSTSKGYVTMPSDLINSGSSKNSTPSGNFCVLGADPSPINPTYVPVSSVPQPESIKLPHVLPDVSTPSSPYVVTGDLRKPSNSGYVPLLSTETTDKNPAYVMAGNKSVPTSSNLMKLESIKPTDLENKPLYVQVADNSNNVVKSVPDSFSWHQTGVENLPNKTGYVTIGDAPGPRTVCTDSTKVYIPHRHFDSKSIKED